MKKTLSHDGRASFFVPAGLSGFIIASQAVLLENWEKRRTA
jgi:hypothetical protein